MWCYAQIFMTSFLLISRCYGNEGEQIGDADAPVYRVSFGENNVVRLNKFKATLDGEIEDTPVVAEFVLPIDLVPGAKASLDLTKKILESSKAENRTDFRISSEDADKFMEKIHSEYQKEQKMKKDVTSRVVEERVTSFVKGTTTPLETHHNHTVERQSTSSHLIEMLFVVDFILYSYFLGRNGFNVATTLTDIQTYYSLILKATNERFLSATSGSFSVSLSISGLIISTDATQSPWTELFKDINGNVNPTFAGPSFATFGLGLNAVLPHDAGVLFTGYRLVDNANTDVSGYTPVFGLLCSILGTVWVADSVDELTSLNLAKYTSDAIGIQRDDQNGCDNSQLNIMSTLTQLPTSTALASNPWLFSSCSVAELAIAMNNNGLTCTLETSNLSPFQTFPFLGQLFGQRYDADSQCQNVQRTVTTFCREQYFPPSSFTFDPDMCYNLNCRGSSGCVQTLAHDGTSCGDRKICSKGLCVSDILAPFRTANCPQLDDPTASCTPASCFDPTVNSVFCCGTCNGIFESSTFSFSVSTGFFQEEGLMKMDATDYD